MNEKLKFFLAGFFIGIAELLPGISGSTVAVAFGIYNKIIKILSNINTKIALYVGLAAYWVVMLSSTFFGF